MNTDPKHYLSVARLRIRIHIILGSRTRIRVKSLIRIRIRIQSNFGNFQLNIKPDLHLCKKTDTDFRSALVDLKDLKWFQNYCTCTGIFASSASNFLTSLSAAIKISLLSCLTETYALVWYGTVV
jgi:hypothetical protein